MKGSGHPMSIVAPSPTCLLFVGATALLGTAGCDEPPAPRPAKPAPSAPASSSAAPEAPPPPTIPILKAEPFTPEGAQLEGLFPIEGALLVSAGTQVGRLEGLVNAERDPKVVWVGEIPKMNPAIGPNYVVSVHGRHPDIVGVVYANQNGRAPEPTYLPLVGKGGSYVVAPGGGWGSINGVAVFGESVVLGINSMMTGSQVLAVRGPKLARFVTKAKDFGCTDEEVPQSEYLPKQPAVFPHAFGGTKAGSLITVGSLCGERGPALEVWGVGEQQSKILPLDEHWKRVSYSARILPGRDDQAWVFSHSWAPVLKLDKGKVTAEPLLERPIRNVFVSPTHELYASDGRTIHRLGKEGWKPVARLTGDTEFISLAVTPGGAFWSASPAVRRLVPTKDRVEVKEAEQDECTTWFVDLYAVSPRNDKKYTYPTTRKALASFPEVAKLGLVEYQDRGSTRRLGITVESRKQGEAVAAHIRETMKDEDPHVFCYAPKEPREIPMGERDAGAKP